MENAKTQENSQPKPPKLRAFKTVQQKFSKAGISPLLAHQAYPFNEKIFMGILLLSTGVASLCVYNLNNDETFAEYIQSIYLESAGIFIIFVLITLILNVEKLFEFIDRCDALLNTSEWKMSF